MMIAKNVLRAVVLCGLAGGLSAQTFATGAFTVPGGSSSFQIAQRVEDNWTLATTFSCQIFGDWLVAAGINPGAPCFGDVMYYQWEPLTGNGQTTGDIEFNFQLTCASISGALSLDMAPFVPVPLGTTIVTAGNGDMIRVTASASPPLTGVPTLGPVWLTVLAALFALGTAWLMQDAKRSRLALTDSE